METTWTETLEANTQHATCRNCGEAIKSAFRARWVSDKDGDICFKSHLDTFLGPLSAVQQNRLHVPPRA